MTPLYSLAAKRAVDITLTHIGDPAAQTTALACLHDAAGYFAIDHGLTVDQRVEAQARSLALLIHLTSAGGGEDRIAERIHDAERIISNTITILTAAQGSRA